MKYLCLCALDFRQSDSVTEHASFHRSPFSLTPPPSLMSWLALQLLDYHSNKGLVKKKNVCMEPRNNTETAAVSVHTAPRSWNIQHAEYQFLDNTQYTRKLNTLLVYNITDMLGIYKHCN